MGASVKKRGLVDWEKLQARAKRHRTIVQFLALFGGLTLCAYAVSLFHASGGVISAALKPTGIATPQLFDMDRDYAEWLTAFAALVTILVLVATAGFSIFGYSIIRDAQTSQKTLQLIEKTNEDREVFGLFEQLRIIEAKYGDSIPFADVYDEFTAYISTTLSAKERADYQRQDYDYIVHLLNLYETWAVGVIFGSINDEMLSEFWRKPLVGHWTQLVSFVEDHRALKQNEEAYVNAEALAVHWATADELAEIQRRKREWLRARQPVPKPSLISNFKSIIKKAA